MIHIWHDPIEYSQSVHKSTCLSLLTLRESSLRFEASFNHLESGIAFNIPSVIVTFYFNQELDPSQQQNLVTQEQVSCTAFLSNLSENCLTHTLACLVISTKNL